MRNLHKGIIGAAAGVLMSSTAAYADCDEVTITEMDWASSAMITAVAKFIMVEGYGCEVTKVPSATLTSIASMAETGKPDIATEVWLNSVPLYLELESKGEIQTATSVLSDGGEEGWWVPAYLAEEHPELTTIEGILANPELVGGKFHNCPVGWGCRVANDNLKVAFDLEGNGIEVFDHGSSETLSASIASAYADQQPWFGYYWAPTAVLGKYPMAKVDMGPHIPEIHACNQTDDCATPDKSAYPVAPVLTAVTTTFAENEPEIAALMGNLAFTNSKMGEILAWQQDNNASADEAAVFFLVNNPDIWGEWLNDEAKANLSGLLN